MKPSELTIRGLILGAVIAIIFTAANVYLGLRVGITIASSIPAAVISMGIFRLFNTGTIRENNIVQTIASAAGTLAAIIFVLPGLGSALVIAIDTRDYPMLQGIVLLFVVIVLLVNILVDVVNNMISPQLRKGTIS